MMLPPHEIAGQYKLKRPFDKQWDGADQY